MSGVLVEKNLEAAPENGEDILRPINNVCSEFQPGISHHKSNVDTDVQDQGDLSQSHTRLGTAIAGVRP